MPITWRERGTDHVGSGVEIYGPVMRPGRIQAYVRISRRHRGRNDLYSIFGEQTVGCREHDLQGEDWGTLQHASGAMTNPLRPICSLMTSVSV